MKLNFEINIEELCKKEKISFEEVEKALFYPSRDVPSLVHSIVWIRDCFIKQKYKLESLNGFWKLFSKELIEVITDEYLENFPDIYEIVPGEIKNHFFKKWCEVIDKRNKEAKKNPALRLEKALETYNLAPLASAEKKKSLEILREVSEREIKKALGIVELRKLLDIVPKYTPERNLLIQKIMTISSK